LCDDQIDSPITEAQVSSYIKRFHFSFSSAPMTGPSTHGQQIVDCQSVSTGNANTLKTPKKSFMLDMLPNEIIFEIFQHVFSEFEDRTTRILLVTHLRQYSELHLVCRRFTACLQGLRIKGTLVRSGLLDQQLNQFSRYLDEAFGCRYLGRYCELSNCYTTRDLGNIDRIYGPVWYNPRLDEIAPKVLEAAHQAHDIGVMMWFAYIASSRFTQHLRKRVPGKAVVYEKTVRGSPRPLMEGEQTLVHSTCDLLHFRPGPWELDPDSFPRKNFGFIGIPVQSFVHISAEPNYVFLQKEEKEDMMNPTRFWVWFIGCDYDNDYYNCAEMFVIDVVRKLVYDPGNRSQEWVSASADNLNKGYTKKYRWLNR
jgi:hypothetical protein